MKFEIYKEAEKALPIEAPIKLKLQPSIHGGGGVTLVAVDEKGNALYDGHLLKITAEGRVLLFRTVNSKLGFDLDSSRRLQIDRN